MNNISATIVADSVNQQGDRLTSLLITFPKIYFVDEGLFLQYTIKGKIGNKETIIKQIM